MTNYCCIEPHRLDPQITVKIVLDDNEILALYWNTWKANMIKAGKPKEMITESNCIEDWAVVNWAWEDDIPNMELGVVVMDYDMWKDYDKRMQSKDCYKERV